MNTVYDKIILDISESDTAHVYDEQAGFIQQKAMLDLARLTYASCKAHINDGFKERLSTAMTGVKPYPRFHDAIFIDGDRGSGKTSFLLTAIDMVCHPDTKSNVGAKVKEIIGNLKLHSLGIIDPTLVTTRNNFFILVISRIKNIVERERRNKRDVDWPAYDYQEWNDSLRSLASGLSMLDRVGTEPLGREEWGDAQYVLQKGLSDAENGLALEIKFHKFVACSLKYIQKDAFVLGFDDIDTDFTKGVEVMQVMRKYLTTPQLIIYMTANYKMLYDMLFQHFRSFFKDNVFKDIKNSRKISSEVETLVSQYFKKIFPADRRLALETQHDIYNKLYINIPEDMRNEVFHKNSIKLIHFYYAIIYMWYRFPKEICRAVGEFFFTLPVRTTIILLKSLLRNRKIFIATAQLAACKESVDEGTESEQNAGAQDSSELCEKVKDIYNDESFYYVTTQICYAFKEELIAIGYDIEDLRTEFNLRMYKIGKFLYANRMFETYSSFVPLSIMQESDRMVFFCYPILHFGLVQKIENIFKYYIRILALGDFVNKLGYDNQYVKKLVSDFYDEQTSCAELCDSFVIESIRNGIYEKDAFLIPVNSCCDDSYKFCTKYIRNMLCLIIGNNEKCYLSVYHVFAFLLSLFETHGDLNFMIERHTYLRQFSRPETNRKSGQIDVINVHEDESEASCGTIADNNIFSNIEQYIWQYSFSKTKYEIVYPYYILKDVYEDIKMVKKATPSEKVPNWCHVFIEIVERFYKKFTDSAGKLSLFPNCTSEEAAKKLFEKIVTELTSRLAKDQ